MNKFLTVLLIIISTINCHSQIAFESGYYINNSNDKIECLIKNMDWKNNPTEFEYKKTENGETQKLTIESVKEFSIYNNSKYIRKNINIDRSSSQINNLSNNKNPTFKEEQLFLKVLVQGKANLYLFEDSNLKRYFYNIDNSDIEQLVYKNYLTPDFKLGKNNQFKQQLWANLKCPDIKLNDVEHLEYNKNSLIHFFNKYNKCNNSDFINYGEKQKRDLFNLTLRPRFDNSSLSIQNSSSNSRDTNFGSKSTFGLGIEVEYILPFNGNKLAIVIEPTYQNFKSNKTTEVNNVSGGKLISEVNYSSIEFPLSMRYYFFLNNNSKIFINASVIPDFTTNSSIKFSRNDGSVLNTLEIKSRPNYAIGIGYKQNDKFSLEIRCQTSREILRDYLTWSSNYNKTLSIILGYSLF
jgi:hypothetical protein